MDQVVDYITQQNMPINHYTKQHDHFKRISFKFSEDSPFTMEITYYTPVEKNIHLYIDQPLVPKFNLELEYNIYTDISIFHHLSGSARSDDYYPVYTSDEVINIIKEVAVNKLNQPWPTPE
jgi:hypothetical protein